MANKQPHQPSDTVADLPKAVILVHGDKGGVGKTMTATAFVDWALKRGLPVALVDADTRNADAIRMYQGQIPAASVDLQRDEGWMDLVDFAMSNRNHHIVVSMPGGVGDRVIAEVPNLWEVLGKDRRLGLLWVMNRGPDSVNLLDLTLQALDPHLAFSVVIKNLYFGGAEDFTRWDESAVKKRFEGKGGITICLGELVDRVVDKVFNDPKEVLPYSTIVVEPAAWESSPKKLTASENVRLQQWLAGNQRAFERIAEVGKL